MSDAERPPWASNTRKLISVVQLPGPAIASAVHVPVNLAGAPVNGAVGEVFGEQVPSALSHGVA